jgi:hypothetical protein
MSKKISASDAKNNLGGRLDDVATLGRVKTATRAREQDGQWGKTHMIPPELARSARMLNRPFDEE